jgi:two-component system, LytTR family, sensor histidine kinase AlgZ
MHPILASGRRLLLYLLAWVPVLAFLAYACWASTGIPPAAAAALLAPACLVFAFACLSPWYLCRALPLGLSAPFLSTWGAASAAAGAVLAGGAALAASLPARELHVPLGLLAGIGVLLYVLSAGLHYAAAGLAQSRVAERRAAEARTLAREAELRALKMQLNPHFLFNCLHAIAALAVTDGPRARDMCVRLSDFLRGGLGLGDRESIPLGEELELARSYLEVERVRFGGRLRVEEEIEPGCDDCPVPALLLQPLVENAVKHGIAGLVEGGAIRLAARREGDGVSITIENAFDPEMPPPPNLGLGLENVRRRLAVRYGGGAVFEAGVRDGLYRVRLRLPSEPSMASISRA